MVKCKDKNSLGITYSQEFGDCSIENTIEDAEEIISLGNHPIGLVRRIVSLLLSRAPSETPENEKKLITLAATLKILYP